MIQIEGLYDIPAEILREVRRPKMGQGENRLFSQPFGGGRERIGQIIAELNAQPFQRQPIRRKALALDAPLPSTQLSIYDQVGVLLYGRES